MDLEKDQLTGKLNEKEQLMEQLKENLTDQPMVRLKGQLMEQQIESEQLMDLLKELLMEQ